MYETPNLNVKCRVIQMNFLRSTYLSFHVPSHHNHNLLFRPWKSSPVQFFGPENLDQDQDQSAFTLERTSGTWKFQQFINSANDHTSLSSNCCPQTMALFCSNSCGQEINSQPPMPGAKMKALETTVCTGIDKDN